MEASLTLDKHCWWRSVDYNCD